MPQPQYLSISVNALAAAGDILIAGALCRLLHLSRTGLKRCPHPRTRKILHLRVLQIRYNNWQAREWDFPLCFFFYKQDVPSTGAYYYLPDVVHDQHWSRHQVSIRSLHSFSNASHSSDSLLSFHYHSFCALGSLITVSYLSFSPSPLQVTCLRCFSFLNLLPSHPIDVRRGSHLFLHHILFLHRQS